MEPRHPKKATISIIAAMDRNRLIGRDGDLPWRLPADFRHFKATTMGHHLIMGRRTFESMPGILAGRTIVVVTRQNDYGAEGALVASSIDDALEMSRGDDEIFIAGGALIYRQALAIVDRMYLTFIDAAFEGDTWFPEWDASLWKEVSRVDHEPDEKNRWPYAFVVLERVDGR